MLRRFIFKGKSMSGYKIEDILFFSDVINIFSIQEHTIFIAKSGLTAVKVFIKHSFYI